MSLSYCIASPSPLPSPVLLHSTIAETHTLQNRLAAAISLAIDFSRNGHAGDKDDVDVASERHKEFCETLLHKASLFTATAYLILRNDDEPNYAKHEAGQIPPPRLPAGHKFRPFIWQDPILWLRITFTLHNYSKNDRKEYYACEKFPVIGAVTAEEIAMLSSTNKDYFSKAHLAMHWVLEVCTVYYLKGGFGHVAPPIISRLHQEFGHAMHGFDQARRISYVPFPFTYAQLTEFLVMTLLVSVAMMMNAFVSSLLLGILFTFFSCMGFTTIYESSKELEDPFISQPNDLPMLTWQGEFNEMMLLLQTYTCDPDSLCGKARNTSPEYLEVATSDI